MQPRDPVARVQRAGRGASELARRLSTVPRATPAVTKRGVPSDARDREVLDILTHGVRTPVTTIYGGAQLLATRNLTPERRKVVAADIRAEADRLYRLVEDLLVLVRSERDGLCPVGEPIALGHLVVRAIEEMAARHPDSDIRYLGTHDAAADGADEVLVMHVLRNLLDNAVRYGTGDPIEVLVGGSMTEVAVRIVHRGGPPSRDGDPFALSSETAGTDAGRAGGGIGLYVGPTTSSSGSPCHAP